LLHTLFLDRLCPTLLPPHFLADWDHGDTRSVDQVMGAFLMIRRTLFEQLGGFDERFFLYYEDVDLCLRVRQASGRVVYFAGARAHHIGGGTTEAVKDQRLFYLATGKVQPRLSYCSKCRFVGFTRNGVILPEPVQALASHCRRP
jgi:GT2 family glycosyltransferase